MSQGGSNDMYIDRVYQFLNFDRVVNRGFGGKPRSKPRLCDQEAAISYLIL